MLQCLLCAHAELDHWHRFRERDYWYCPVCRLVSVPRVQHLCPVAEKAEYDKHENSVADPGYRRFLRRPFRAITDALPSGAAGLDFGCGPGPALASMLEQAGYPTRLYDLYYRPDESVWRHRYEFISLTEVIEHLARPWPELERLWRHLHPGGRLVVQTQRVRDRQAFRHWRYLHDPTHIAFYAPGTFDWLGRVLGASEVRLPDPDVAVLYKPRDAGVLDSG